MAIPTSHANRGLDFEALINQSNELYRRKRIACISKIPTEFIPLREGGKIISAKVTRKSVCDYIGTANGISIAFEAKSTMGDGIRLAEVKPHQAVFLDDWENCGGQSFVLLSFRLMDFAMIPWKYWVAASEGGIYNAKKIKKSAQMKLGGFPKEWQFGLGGRAPVDYLSHIFVPKVR